MLSMIGSGIELMGVPPDPPKSPSALNVLPPVPCPGWPPWPDEPPGAAWTMETVVAAAAPVPGDAAAAPAELAPATAARRAAEEPPALLAAGVEAGSRKGVIAPRVDARAGPDALEPPRGGRAAPPPGRLAGCHGDEMP